MGCTVVVMTENKRYIDGGEECIEDQFLIDTETDKCFYIDHGLDEIIKRLNNQEDEIQQLKWSNKVLRANRKDCELGRREERKRWLKMDKMRIEHIQLLQKRLKENSLSIYVYGDDAND